MEHRARGRARGRTSSRPVQEGESSQQQQQQQQGPHRPGDQRGGRAGTSGGPAAASPAWSGASSMALSGLADSDTAGPSRASQRESPAQAGPSEGGHSTQGGGDVAGSSVGRGAMRGRRQLAAEIVHTRPDSLISKQGVSGRELMLQANYFKLRSTTDWVVYQYRVDFAPEEEHNGFRKALMRIHRENLGGFIFDGSVLYSCHRFPNDPMELFSTRQGDGEIIRITVRLVKQLGQGDYQYLQLFNTIMRKCLGALKLQLVGRNYYDPIAKVQIHQHRMELWPGYVTSIRQHEGEILMCAEITNKVMRMDTVLEMLVEMHRQCGDRHDFQLIFKNAVLGLVVLTDYNNRTYRIDDVDFGVTPLSTFLMKDKREISYLEYYNQRYQIRIRNSEQPLLVSKSKPRELRAGQAETVYLVPELCRMTGLTDRMRENFQLMRALAEYTRVGPGTRVQKLIAFSKRLMDEPLIVQDLGEWNMALAPNLVSFRGRVLPSELLVQGSAPHFIKYESGQNADWTNNLRSNPMLHIANFHTWVVMVPGELSRDAQNFMGLIMRAARGMHMRMSEPYVHQMPDDRQGTYVNHLEQVLSQKNPQLVACIVSNNRADRYGAIKKKCCVDRAVPTQVITKRAMSSRGALSVATKIAIQMNCKVGGAPWAVELPLQGLMVVGFDVSHDTMNRGQSYGAMVASLNSSFSRFFSAVSAHRSGEEMSNEISINLLKALQKFRKYNNGNLPSRIIIYRDGVGDGQIPYVFNHEVVLIKEQLKLIYSGDIFRMAFIIVSKKINTRIFCGDQNPPPGTVVDDCITLPERYDFFICSQSVRQGSVSPTSYNVISDNSGLDPDKMQRITYKMTHLYYNWSGTVKVPAPVQYAHKLAMLVGQSLHRIPHNDLDDLLYFL